MLLLLVVCLVLKQQRRRKNSTPSSILRLAHSGPESGMRVLPSGCHVLALALPLSPSACPSLSLSPSTPKALEALGGSQYVVVPVELAARSRLAQPRLRISRLIGWDHETGALARLARRRTWPRPPADRPGAPCWHRKPSRQQPDLIFMPLDCLLVGRSNLTIQSGNAS